MTGSMRRGYRLIFWGLLLASLRLNDGAALALPPLLGCALLFFGIRRMVLERGEPVWKMAQRAAFGMILVAAAELAQPFVLSKEAIPSVLVLLWTALRALLALLAGYGTFAGMIEMLRGSEKEEAARKYERDLCQYLLFFGIVTLGGLGSIVCSSERGCFIAFIAGLVLQAWLLAKLYGLQKAAGAGPEGE